MFTDIIQQAAEGHELRDELHRGRQADAQEAAHVRVVHTGHHVGFLGAEEERAYQKGSPPWLTERAGFFVPFRVQKSNVILSLEMRACGGQGGP